ncbi:hypothetical protein JG687_00005959 [Phytophthora cactorum]|uniref:Uncharacterized protein n=1 Tax=Phytophthora cactorum TaxID=29920 RepID=A0A8T1UP89_9STRA|nr:hypothetical protein JG687_00005959 [Phytophthora cactorum]
MNWMTSGKHRALYSQRGRRRQMHFPSQVQHQRVKPTSPSRSSQPRVRDSAKPWYIVSIGDDDESQGSSMLADIRVLELERKGAMSAAGIDAEEKVRETARVGGREDAGAPSSPRQKRGREQEQSAQDGRSENRCIFTPVKKTRKYGQPPGAAQLLKSTREERPPSSIASGVDMLFFNDGEELPHKNRALRTKQVVAEPVPQDAHINRLSQHISDTGEHDELRVCEFDNWVFMFSVLTFECLTHSYSIHARFFETKIYTVTVEKLRLTSSHPTATPRVFMAAKRLLPAGVRLTNEIINSGESTPVRALAPAFSRPDSGSFGNAKDP